MVNDILVHTLRWFEKAVPSPTDKNVHTQLGVHFEEVGEMLEAIQSNDAKTDILLQKAEAAVFALAKHLKASEGVLTLHSTIEIKLLDAICDQIVTAAGVGHMLNFDVAGAMEEINASNWSKFENGQPIFDANKKIQKGPNYFKANLSKFLPFFAD